MYDFFNTPSAFCRRTEEAWTDHGRLCTLAYTQMRRVLTVQVDQIESSVGLTLGRQRDGLKDGSFRPTRRWARGIRTAILWSDQLHVPLREGTLSRLDRSDRRHTMSTGTIEAEVDQWKFKNIRPTPFRARYHPHPGFQYPVHIYYLYVLEGGARDVLRTDISGTSHPISAFYVPDVLSTTQERLSVLEIKRIIREGLCAALYHDPNRLGPLRYSDLAPFTNFRAFQCAVTNQVMSHTRGRSMPLGPLVHSFWQR